MIKIHKHIEIVRSTLPGLTSMSQESCASIVAVLRRHYARVQVSIINQPTDLERLVARRPDLVFLGMKYLPIKPQLGQRHPAKIWLAQYLERNDILYTGSGHLAHALEIDKPLAKQRAIDAGLCTSSFSVARQNQLPSRENISMAFPLFVKPTDRGSGAGIDGNSVVYDFDGLRLKVQSITNDLQSDSLIEEYLPGREFSVGILKIENSEEFSVMPVERILPADENGIRLFNPDKQLADIWVGVSEADSDIKASISALALSAFQALGARDYGRIDIRLDKDGTPQFLEANLLPSLNSDYSNFAKACLLNRGFDYQTMILIIVNLALERSVTADEEPLPFPAIPVLAT